MFRKGHQQAAVKNEPKYFRFDNVQNRSFCTTQSILVDSNVCIIQAFGCIISQGKICYTVIYAIIFKRFLPGNIVSKGKLKD